MSDFRSVFAGKKVTVMGLGLLGRGLNDALFLVRCNARVTVTDLKTADELAPSIRALAGLPVTFTLGGHDERDFIEADMILRNADVPRSSPFLKIARQRGIPVEMDESLFCKLFRGTVIGVTGTRGKTTTTVLLHRILCSGTTGVHLGGNISGLATLPILERAGPSDTVVLELSSWQLQGFRDAELSPNASIFTNIYPDHLNRYTSMAEYINDKKAIFQYQRNGDICLFNADQPASAEFAAEAPAMADFFRRSDVPADWRLRLLGTHNVENVASALRLAVRLGVPASVVRNAVESFEGVDFRLQSVGTVRGVEFVNDATSTTPVSGCAAMEALADRQVLLIAGGADKGLDMTPFGRVARKAKNIALLEGTATDALEDAIAESGGQDRIVGRFPDLETAVRILYHEAQPGDVILLSPGCASFGMFVNEFDRAEQFNRIAGTLRTEFS